MQNLKMALDFIQSQRFAYGDLAEQYGQLEDLYNKKCVRAVCDDFDRTIVSLGAALRILGRDGG